MASYFVVPGTDARGKLGATASVLLLALLALLLFAFRDALAKLDFRGARLGLGRESPDCPWPHDGYVDGGNERVAEVELRTAVVFQLASSRRADAPPNLSVTDFTPSW